ncbi:hypothetical protein ALI22I_19880 [Saccharothrix sp. ALI-22-I]|nr:hypothetical protein ALI22I_19880 [Saccharothrix sp. ALI-22-I]
MALQRRAVDQPAPLYLQACPGAGKTRVIVERHIVGGRPSGRSGRALVSFTNVACDEIHQRCRAAGYPDLLAFPNFVGTIDTFIWRYLVRPFIPQDRHRHRIDSWDRINATITVQGSREYRIRLSDFQFHRNSPGGDCEARLQRTTRNYAMFKALELESLIRHAEEAAVEARDNFGKQGYVTGHEIRILALHALRSHGPTMATMLRGRFDELIVDEAQDCSNLDLAILGQLRDAGLPLVFVCDPDQAIYEFRGARPGEVRAFGATLGTRIDLTGNWRSSSAVCGLAASLRPADSDREVDDPIGTHHDEPAGILLLRTKKTDVERALAIFTTYADRMGIPIESRLVLAHAGGKLPKRPHPQVVLPVPPTLCGSLGQHASSQSRITRAASVNGPTRCWNEPSCVTGTPVPTGAALRPSATNWGSRRRHCAPPPHGLRLHYPTWTKGHSGTGVLRPTRHSSATRRNRGSRERAKRASSAPLAKRGKALLGRPGES